MKVLSLNVAKELHKKCENNIVNIPEEVFISKEAQRYFDINGVAVNVIHDRNDNLMSKKLSERKPKPEYMTNLNKDELVVKSNPRIKLRGLIDSFQADILRLQIIAENIQDSRLLSRLEDIWEFSRKILVAEVLDKTLESISLFGLGEKELRYISQHPLEYFGFGHIAPNYRMGEVCIELNALRTKSREVELAAIDAFCKPPRIDRLDIIKALNRLSRGIYIIYCKYLEENGIIECMKD